MWSIWFWTLNFDQCKECSLHLIFVKYWFSPRKSQWPVVQQGRAVPRLALFPCTIVDRLSLVQGQWDQPQLPWVHDYNGCVMLRRCNFAALLHPYHLALTFVPSLLPQDCLNFINVPFRVVHSTVPYPSNKTSLYSRMFTCKEKLPWLRLSVAFVYEYKHMCLENSLTHISLNNSVCCRLWRMFSPVTGFWLDS